MTKQEQERVKIAQFEGWDGIQGGCWGYPPDAQFGGSCALPDYHNNYNELRNVIIKLSVEHQNWYYMNLCNSISVTSEISIFRLLTATLEQMCEALVKTIEEVI